MKPKRTWVVIADGGEAKVFESQGLNSDLVPVDDMTMAIELPASRDILADRPGRSYESQGRARHAIENATDPHRELKREFAKTVANALAACLTKKRFDRLVIVAPPSVLGDLRDELPKRVRAKVAAELGKDLVKTPHCELPDHLEEALGPQYERSKGQRY